MNKDKLNSLKWAIDELSKQKEELNSKLSIAKKRDDTSSLIDEVHAQKIALDKRISSLEDGLKASAELVEDSVGSLEEELISVDEKLMIAKERLDNLEQEEYLEELGRKLNGDFSSDNESNTQDNILPSDSSETLLPLLDSTDTPIKSTTSQSKVSNSDPMTSTILKSSTNRLQNPVPEEQATTIGQSEIINKPESLEDCSPATLQDLCECANILGVEPDFLLNKGIQAVIRMVARNGNKLSFPLEVQQLD